MRASTLRDPRWRNWAWLVLALWGCSGESVSPRGDGAATPPAASPFPPAPGSALIGERVQVGEFDLPPELPLSSVSGDLLRGQDHTYRIDLEKDQYLHLAVEQQGLDVKVTLSRAGARLIEVDGPRNVHDTEEVFWIAEGAGRHDVTIERGGPSGAVSGRYVLRRVELRPAEQEDRHRVTAAQALAEATTLGNSPEAFDLYERALDLWERLGDRRRRSETLFKLGILYWDVHKDARKSVELHELALEILEEDPFLRAATLHSLGRRYNYLGELNEAFDRTRRARRLWSEVGYRRGEVEAAFNLGSLHRIRGDLPEALNLYEQALEQWIELGDRAGQATALHNRGRCYFYFGQFEQAFDDLQQALEIQEDLGDQKEQAVTLTSIGQVHTVRSEYEKALGVYRRALELRETTGDRRGQAVTLISLAGTYAALKQKEMAVEHFRQALPIAQAVGNDWLEAWIFVELHQVLEPSDPRVLEYLRKALPLFRKLEAQDAEVTTLGFLAQAHRERGELESARRSIEEALLKIEQVRRKPASLALRSSFFAIPRYQGLHDDYVDLLMELHARDPSRGYDAEALAASERARARSQLDALIESGTEWLDGIDPALREKKQALQEAINAKEVLRMELLEEATGEQIAALDRSVRDLLRESDRVQARIRRSNPRYAALAEPRILDAEAIRRELLDSETLLLEYKLGARRSFVWAVTSTSVTSFELPPRERIEKMARHTYQLLSLGNRRESLGPTRLALENLSETLLGPVAELLNGQRLLIVREGALQYIPFSALPIPPREGESGPAVPLVGAHEIYVMPSASTLAELRRRLAGRAPAPKWVAVVADPVFQSHDPRLRDPLARGGTAGRTRSGDDLQRFERLVYSGQEAETILELVPPEKSLRAIGFDAHRGVLMGEEIRRYRILHIATHGDLNAAQPQLSRLVFSRFDGQGRQRGRFLLHAHEIYGLELPVELVVLSGCQTALGEQKRGEGLVGLPQAFMYAGAARVLVSLWQVNDQATAELMTRFYERLLEEGSTPGAALREAQLSVAAEKRWQAPYYWAGFVLQGDWRKNLLLR